MFGTQAPSGTHTNFSHSSGFMQLQNSGYCCTGETQ